MLIAPLVLRISKYFPFPICLKKDLLKYPLGQIHLLIDSETLLLEVWISTGNNYVRKLFHSKLPCWSQVQKDRAFYQVTSCPGRSGLVVVLDSDLLQYSIHCFYTARKVSVCGVFLVSIFPHSDWIRRDTEYLSVFSPNVRKYGPEKLRIQTLFKQC